MMAAPSRLGLESRKAGSDRAALENGGFEEKEIIWHLGKAIRCYMNANLRKKATYSARYAAALP